MAFIKKTVVVTTSETTQTIKTVQCPYCKVHLEPVPKYVTAMICWKCSKEFRIEVDPDKIIAPELPSVTGQVQRTMMRGSY